MGAVGQIVQRRVDKAVGEGNTAVRHYIDDLVYVGRPDAMMRPDPLAGGLDAANIPFSDGAKLRKRIPRLRATIREEYQELLAEANVDNGHPSLPPAPRKKKRKRATGIESRPLNRRTES